MPTSPERGDGAPLLAVDTVAVGYHGVPILSGVSLTVAEGQIVCLAGPNGCGKSTLLKTLIRELPLLAGTIALQGRDIGSVSSDALARMGVAYVPQVEDVFDTLTVRENLEMGGYVLARGAVRDRIEALYELFPPLRELDRRVVRTLSGGERKLVSLARALMPSPALLVVDEPTAALSARATGQVLRSHLPELAATGVGVLLVEQKVKEAFAIADYAYVLVHGRVGLEGTGRELIDRGDLGEVFMAAGARH